jgi:signal transduction histidine kinase
VVTRRAGVLVSVAAAALAAGAMAISGHDAGGIAVGVVLGAALGAARSHPRATWIFAVVLMLATAPVDGLALFEEGGGSAAAYVIVAAHAFCAGRYEARVPSVTALVLVTGASEVLSAFTHDSPGFWAAPVAGWAAGWAVAERDHVAAQLRQRARELDEEREAHATLSVRYERARIASELHDIVAHAISVMVVQASAGQRLAARDPELTAQAFAAIAGAARQAEADMGRLVALLGDEDAIGPAPDLALVEELVARATGSGLDVTLRLEGEREGLPARVGEAAYRVIQEGLTNALRYASGAPVRVLVRGGATALVVEVANGPAGHEAALVGAGTGNGLRGLRELVGACGGTLEAGPTADGGWQLTATVAVRVHPESG